MLRKFRIKINEKEYMVEMEEFGAPAVAAAPTQAVPVQAAPAPVAAPIAAPTAPAPAPVVGSRRRRGRKPSTGRTGSHET